jgi:hypothetical protein
MRVISGERKETLSAKAEDIVAPKNSLPKKSKMTRQKGRTFETQ